MFSWYKNKILICFVKVSSIVHLGGSCWYLCSFQGCLICPLLNSCHVLSNLEDNSISYLMYLVSRNNSLWRFHYLFSLLLSVTQQSAACQELCFSRPVIPVPSGIFSDLISCESEMDMVDTSIKQQLNLEWMRLTPWNAHLMCWWGW